MKLIILSTLFISQIIAAQVYQAKNVTSYFFAKYGDESIKGENSFTNIQINLDSNSISGELEMDNFRFHNDKNRKIFLNDVIESSKYKKATFHGQIKTYSGEKHLLSGFITIHGVKWKLDTPLNIIKSDSICTINTSFTLMYPDFNIRLPKKYSKKMNSEVKVSIEGTLNSQPK